MARKADEDRIAYAARVRGYTTVHITRHAGNPDFITLHMHSGDRVWRCHTHTLENLLRWIRRQGRANG